MKRKGENGAITLFALVAGLTFILFLTTMLMIGSVKRQSQAEATKQIEQIYSSGDADSTYFDYFGEGAVPIYTSAQLQEMCRGEQIAINEEGGKYYTFSSDAVYVLMNDITFDYDGIWSLPEFSNNGRLEGNGKTIKTIDTTSNEFYFYNESNNYDPTNESNDQDVFAVAFDGNGGTDGATIYRQLGKKIGPLPTSIRNGYMFLGWYTETTGGDMIDENTIVQSQDIIYHAQWQQSVAQIVGDTTPYNTLQAAISAVLKNNIEKEVRLLTNVSENLTIQKDQNIKLDLQNYTISNNTTAAVIENSGTLKISNGTIQTTSTSNGAVNNNSGGDLTISGGNITVGVGGKQAVYNNGGTLAISGSAYISSEGTSGSNQRATVHNVKSGDLTITGGTIKSTNFIAVYNELGTMTIGIQGGNVDKTSPVMQGGTYGVSSTPNFEFYDGIAKGKLGAMGDVSKITGKETGYGIANSQELINGETYKTAYLAVTATVTFVANGGTVSETTREAECGEAIGILPTPTRDGYRFTGWYTETTDGDEINENTIVPNQDVRYYAQWEELVRYCVSYVFGNESFTGSNYINTNLNLFSQNNLHKDFEIQFSVSNFEYLEGQENGRNVLMCNQYEVNSPYEGFAFQYRDGSIKIQGNSTKAPSSPSESGVDSGRMIAWGKTEGAIVISRKDDKLYVDNTLLVDYVNINRTHNAPLTIGANVDKNLNPRRYCKADLSNIIIKIYYSYDEFTSLRNNLPTPTKTGYTFGGWYTQETGGTNAATTEWEGRNITIYARWNNQ